MSDIDFIGNTYNKLTVIKRIKNNKKNHKMWECICECGNITSASTYDLTHNKKKSCGCLRKISANKTHFEDLSGLRFGKLSVLERSDNRGRHTMWKCLCDCGNITDVGAYDLKTGNTQSCGCLKFESKNFTHNHSSEKIYHVWENMKKRCISENDYAYKWYGGRGITVCEEWLTDFISFYNWSMENGYSEGLTIDRIDTNGNYEPSNCRWVTMKIQQNNRRNSIILSYKGTTKTISEWCEITGMKHSTLYNRIKSGYSPEECFEVPLCSRRGKKRN